MNTYREAAEKTRAWLDAYFDAEGRCTIDPNEARYYPKAPYLLNAAGLRSKGARAAKWVLEQFIDAEGNLYVAAGLHKTRKTSETLDTRPGIHVISPAGKLVAFRQTPTDTITNCTFGGPDLRTLYITSGAHLHSLHTAIPGKASYKIGG